MKRIRAVPAGISRSLPMVAKTARMNRGGPLTEPASWPLAYVAMSHRDTPTFFLRFVA